jgi:hypothetical protein
LTSRKDISGLLQEYAILKEALETAKTKTNNDSQALDTKEGEKAELETEIDNLEKEKKRLHNNFYARYSRFIQEGTWQDDKYNNDDSYYADAQSVLYDSCYPKVAYTINVVALDGIPGYECYDFDVGDKTYVEDENFFGSSYKEEVIVNEITDNLDDPSKKVIKVQNFKNQFQDLFQRITASVQRAEYRSGAYEKAAKVINEEGATVAKQQFLFDALDNAAMKLTTAGQQTVVWDSSGITVTEKDKPCNSIRMVGGAILLSKQDENGEMHWTTGVTSDGISANLITAGTLNAGEIKIMSGRDPVFRWDEFGITAFDRQDQKLNTKKFVRFDKNGLYGIDANQEGETYSPSGLDEIEQDATFSLTWNGLKVTGNDGATLHLGKQGNAIFEIKSGDKTVFGVDGKGTIQMSGNLSADSTIDNMALTAVIDQHIEEFNFHTIEYGEKIDNTINKIDELKADMVPLSFYPNGIIVEEGNGEDLEASGDKSKLFCSEVEEEEDKLIKIFYYVLNNGAMTITNATLSNFFSEEGAASKTVTYFLKPLRAYYYYTAGVGWRETTNIDNITVPTLSYTGIVDKANDTEAILAHLVGYKTITDSQKTEAYSNFVSEATEKAAELAGLV